MERRRISIFESFLSGGSVGKRARKVQKAALNAWRKNYVIVDILSTLSNQYIYPSQGGCGRIGLNADDKNLKINPSSSIATVQGPVK